MNPDAQRAGGAVAPRVPRPVDRRRLPALRTRMLVALAAGLLSACASIASLTATGPVSNRPDGEGYAGAGELVLRLGPPAEKKSGWFTNLASQHKETATVELRYVGLDANGRAVFRRHDVDAIAGPPVPMNPPPGDPAAPRAAALPPDTRDIVVDMRLARQIRIQGKIIEIVEASRSGVVFNLY
jgi:hypothetical protein